MAKFTAGPGAVGGIDLATFDIEDIVNEDAGATFTGPNNAATELTFSSTASSFHTFRGKFVVTGTSPNLTDVTSGTINEIEQVDNNSQSSLLAGLSMSVAQFETFLNAKNSQGFLAAAFAGADIITGSDKADNMHGFAGNDTIDGGAGNDTLGGDAGNDSLIGGLGDDSMDGGAGNDTYSVDSAADAVNEVVAGAAGGNDSVISSAATFTLGANIENLTLAAGAGNNNGTGNALANVLTGNTGNNQLAGNDGNDKLAGSDGNDTLSGGSGNDTLDGGAGNDSLDGGTGNDSMAGGADNDTYVVDSTGDKVTETLTQVAGGGIDTVDSTVTYTLGNNLENLTLLDSVIPIDGTGNALDNEIDGNGKNNKLSGLAGSDTLNGGDGADTLDGGVGKDVMSGGAGNDTYVLDIAVGNDTVSEGAAGGTDTVQAAFDIDLKDFANVENATLLGTAALRATGTDADANLLTGNSGANTLSGGGGNDTLDGKGGADSLVGGKGDDVYFLDNAGDTLAETSGEGTDEIRSTITLSLVAFANIENLTLLGTGALNATGTDGVGNILIGNAGANKLDGKGGDDSMDGGAGNDTYVVDSSADQVSEKTGGSTGGTDTVLSSATFALGANSNIENLSLTGTADLDGTGNELANTITGNDGKNQLDGGAGADKMAGGKNDDIYIVDKLGDTVTETLTAAAGGGADLVKSSVSFTLGNNVENLELTGGDKIDGTGNALNNTISGNGNDNKLSGLAGNDTLGGGGGGDTLDGGTGDDSLTGGAGDDTYMLDSIKDVFNEGLGDSGDTVAATFNLDLNDAKFDNIENATLLGTASTATGDAGANKLTGNAGANTLTGNGGNDTLDGGKGNDSMAGGSGNDIYVVDSLKDAISDSGGDASDEIQSLMTLSLAAFTNIENLTLLGVTAINGTGDGGNNIIAGNDGNNSLSGGSGMDTLTGGLGNDTLSGGPDDDSLAGGKGNDTYVVAAGVGNDTISEATDEGTDTVQSSVDFSLVAIANVENLTLIGAAVSGTGNAGKNALAGNDGNNTLDGGGGADTMAGGKGNDTYIVDSDSDVVNEAANAGTDTVLSSAPNYVLGVNIEQLTLTGSSNIHGTGNTLANLLTGNDGDNVLSGLGGNDTLDGGLGIDTLNGGAGTDTYLYASKDGTDAVNTGDNGFDHVALIGSPFDWDVKRDGNDLLIQAVADEDAGNADFDPTQAIRIVNQYAGAAIAFFTGDFGSDNNLFYGGNPDLTTVFTPVGLTGKDQGANAEVVQGTGANDTINGGGGQTDFLYGNDGNDRINGQSAVGDRAFMYGGTGDDTLIGGVGNDNLRGDEGNDSLDGGAGIDHADYRAAKDGVTVDLTHQDGTAQTISADQGQDILVNIEDARGGNFNDTLIGTSTANSLYGKDGDDSLTGGGGNDFLVGGQGNDTLAGNALGDFAEVSYEDAKVGAIINLTNVIHAGVAAHTAQDGLGGTDVLINIQGALGSDFGDQFFGADDVDDFFEPMGGNDTAAGGGGTGFDDIDFFSSTDAVVASLALQGGSQHISASQGDDVYTGFESMDGSAFNDTLSGDANGNFLQGRDGNDSLSGGDGGDNLRGGAGNDTLDGVTGFDEVDYFKATAGVHVSLALQGVLQQVGAGEGSDLLLNIDELSGSTFNDTLTGDSNSNNLFGLAGNDSLSSGGGGDFMEGGAGNDILRGVLGQFDEASYGDAASAVTVNLSSTTQFGVAAGHALDGSGGIDTLIAIQGVFGSAFNDTLIGGKNDEFFEGQGGDDSIIGGGGFNALEYFNSSDGVTVDLNQQGFAQTISASQGKDTFFNISDIYGSSSADELTGDSNFSGNFLFGRDGNDTIRGGGGQDFIVGGQGDDVITLAGGSFALVSYTSALDGHDVINGFGGGLNGQDGLDLSSLFDSLGVANVARAARVQITGGAGHFDVHVDADGNAGNGFELTVTTINTSNPSDTISIGQDVFVTS